MDETLEALRQHAVECWSGSPCRTCSGSAVEHCLIAGIVALCNEAEISYDYE
jgi:hypothetical protein